MFVSTSGSATILHADLDSFYASVEQRDDPSLRGRPVIVGGGVVLAASYEAKAYGVRTAMGGGQARTLCPHAIVVPPRMSAYSQASAAVFEVFHDTSPLVEVLSVSPAIQITLPTYSPLVACAADADCAASGGVCEANFCALKCTEALVTLSKKVLS